MAFPFSFLVLYTLLKKCSIIIDGKISYSKSVFIIVGIILVSMIFIIVITKKVGKISPVRAISGGKSEVYFDSRLNVPISKRGLSFTLAVRQFTSSKKRYISTNYRSRRSLNSGK